MIKWIRTSKMYDGKFKGRQPESLSPVEWEGIKRFLQTGYPEETISL